MLTLAPTTRNRPQNQRVPHRWSKAGGHARRPHDTTEYALSTVPTYGAAPGAANGLAGREGPQAPNETHRLGDKFRQLARQCLALSGTAGSAIAVAGVAPVVRNPDPALAAAAAT